MFNSEYANRYKAFMIRMLDCYQDYLLNSKDNEHAEADLRMIKVQREVLCIDIESLKDVLDRNIK